MAKKKKAYVTPEAKRNGLVKFDKYLRLINLTNDYMMSQQQFVELCVLMGYGTANVIRADILAEMVRLELIKYCYIGATQAKMILFTKISIRHIKGKDSSDKVASLRDFKSDTPKLLAMMKVKYIMKTVIPSMQRRGITITPDAIKQFLKDANSTLLLEPKDFINYYEQLKNLVDFMDKTALDGFKKYTHYTSARQKILLGRDLTEDEQESLVYHEHFFNNNEGIASYKELALIKDNSWSRVAESGAFKNKKKEKQIYDNVAEYERLPSDPRLVQQFKKQNIYIQSIKENTIFVILFNVKKSLTERELKAYMNSLYMTFFLMYKTEFTINFKVICLNEGATNTYLRMFERADLTHLNSHVNSFEFFHDNLEIADEYLS